MVRDGSSSVGWSSCSAGLVGSTVESFPLVFRVRTRVLAGSEAPIGWLIEIDRHQRRCRMAPAGSSVRAPSTHNTSTEGRSNGDHA